MRNGVSKEQIATAEPAVAKQVETATVTQNVPSDSLAIARVPQVNRVGWAAKRRSFLTTGSRNTISTQPVETPASARAKKTGKKSKKVRSRPSKSR